MMLFCNMIGICTLVYLPVADYLVLRDIERNIGEINETLHDDYLVGYDVVAMASPERFAVGLDISSTAVNKAKEWSSSLPNARYFTFLAEDFFTWTPAELFDVIFDYTFFCAIHPTIRSAWALKVSELLKPDGELITLMYLFDNQEVGPPYNTSVADYVEVLNPVGFKAISIVDNELAVKPRKGAEKLGRWKKSLNQSLL